MSRREEEKRGTHEPTQELTTPFPMSRREQEEKRGAHQLNMKQAVSTLRCHYYLRYGISITCTSIAKRNLKVHPHAGGHLLHVGAGKDEGRDAHGRAQGGRGGG